MHILVVSEHDGERIRPASLSAMGFARQIAAGEDDRVEMLVLGHQIQSVVRAACPYAPVLYADHELLQHPLADRLAPVIAGVARERNVDTVVAASTTWSKDIVGRAAGLLGGTMASDVIEHEFVDGKLLLKRPLFAGSLIATVTLNGKPSIITVRGSNFPAASPLDSACDSTPIDLDPSGMPTASRFETLRAKDQGRPDPTEASIVASGGRAFKSAEDFERLVGTLADRLGAAAGASRTLVNAGGAPSEIQVGQTGKVVTPDLYFALGISGSLQHLAGMKNSRVIAAINTDPNAPIFAAADYGLIGDVYELLPELIEKLS